VSPKLCISAVLAVLLFNIIAIIVWLRARPDSESLTAREALNEIRNSNDLADKMFSYLVYLTRFFWKGFLGLIVAVSAAALSCVGAICAPDTVELLKIIRLILQDFYSFFERVVAG
jgi:hypothetical protein